MYESGNGKNGLEFLFGGAALKKVSQACPRESSGSVTAGGKGEEQDKWKRDDSWRGSRWTPLCAIGVFRLHNNILTTFPGDFYKDFLQLHKIFSFPRRRECVMYTNSRVLQFLAAADASTRIVYNLTPKFFFHNIIVIVMGTVFDVITYKCRFTEGKLLLETFAALELKNIITETPARCRAITYKRFSDLLLRHTPLGQVNQRKNIL